MIIFWGRPGRALQILDALLGPIGVAGGLYQSGSDFKLLNLQGGVSCGAHSSLWAHRVCSRARSVPQAHRVRSRACSVPRAHRVRSRARSFPRAHRVRSRAHSVPWAHIVRSVPWAHRVRSRAHSVPWAHRIWSVPWAHRVRSRAHSVPWAHRIWSVPWAHRVRSVPWAHRDRSVPWAHRVRSVSPQSPLQSPLRSVNSPQSSLQRPLRSGSPQSPHTKLVRQRRCLLTVLLLYRHHLGTHVYLCLQARTTKPVMSSTGIFVAIANNKLCGSKLKIFFLWQKWLGY